MQDIADSPVFLPDTINHGGNAISGVPLCPDLWLTHSRGIPPQIAGELEGVGGFAKHLPGAWLRDPMTRMLVPYWLSPATDQLLSSAVASVLPRCPQSALPWLRESRMLLMSKPAEGSDARDKAYHNHMLRTQRYTVLRDLFPVTVLRYLTAHMRYLQAKGALFKCTQVPERSAIQYHSMFDFFHYQLAHYLNRLMLEKIKASYAFASIYHEGAVLHRHTDRPQCRWNLSLVLGTQPEVTNETAWPIYLDIEGKVVDVRLLPGDAVLYSGTDIPHWRDAQPPGLESVVCFFHFVPQDFAAPLY